MNEKMPRAVAMQDPAGKFVRTTGLKCKRWRTSNADLSPMNLLQEIHAGILLPIAASCRQHRWELMALEVSCDFYMPSVNSRLHTDTPNADSEAKTK